MGEQDEDLIGYNSELSKANQRIAELETACQTVAQQRNNAEAKVSELEKIKNKRDNQLLHEAHNIRELTAQRDTLAAEVERLKGYACHGEECYFPKEPCTCGLNPTQEK